MKKTVLYVAFILYFNGIAVIIDWILFFDNNIELYHDFKTVKAHYISRFPNLLIPFFSLHPSPATLFFALGFMFSGFIFIKQKQKQKHKHKVYLILAITSFLFGMWNLFTLM